MTTSHPTGPCPVCDGSGRRPVAEDQRRWVRPGKVLIAGYDAESDTLPCTNCGGQTMSLHGTGQVYLRADGTPCRHEYGPGPDDGRWRCYHHYQCKHCPDNYAIDSSD